MSRPTRAEQRRARRALLAQSVMVLLALVVVSLTSRRHAEQSPERRR
ncbi:hypothetical protein [Saccharomonospora glauca]|nr:hypothetical protein [Saccharomonospora glauca]